MDAYAQFLANKAKFDPPTGEDGALTKQGRP